MAKVVEADERRIKTFIEHILKILIKVVRETIETLNKFKDHYN